MRLHQSGDPSYEQRIVDYRGKKWYARLDGIRRETIKTDVAYYDGQIEKLTNLIKALWKS